MTFYCSQNHSNPQGSRFCSICGEPLLQSGIVLGDRYRILQELGRGGFGRTYVAEDLNRFQEHCVLKQFAPQVHGEEALRKAQELFEREAGVLYKLQHDQIPRFREMFQSGGRLFLVQDYVTGPTYRELLTLRKNQGSLFQEGEVRQLLEQLLPVLHYIHTLGVVHRDISPDNLICRSSDQKPVLIDFGGVKQVAAVVESQIRGQVAGASATRLGKIGYSPPEQMQWGVVSPTSDLYALGMTLLVLLTGREPQELLGGSTPLWQWQGVSGLSPLLGQVLNRMLADRPADRYSSAVAVLQDLRTGYSTPPPLDPQTQLPGSQLQTGYTATQAVYETPGYQQPVPTRSAGCGTKIANTLLTLLLIAAAGVGSWWGIKWAIESAQKPSNPSPSPTVTTEPSTPPLSPEEQQRKEALGNRREKLGISYDFMVRAVNQLFYAAHPDLNNRQLSTDNQDADLRRQWDETADQFLTQLANLSPESRSRLGQFNRQDLDRWKQTIVKLKLGLRALYDLADTRFLFLFPDQRDQRFIDQPIGQVWYGIVADYVKSMQAGTALEEIRFDPGALDQRVKGTLQPGEGKAYVVNLRQGQPVRVNLQSGAKTLLSIYPPTRDRDPLLQRSTERAWADTLTQSGYYEIVIVSTATDPVAYVLDVAADTLNITPDSPSPSPSISPDISPAPSPSP